MSERDYFLKEFITDFAQFINQHFLCKKSIQSFKVRSLHRDLISKPSLINFRIVFFIYNIMTANILRLKL